MDKLEKSGAEVTAALAEILSRWGSGTKLSSVPDEGKRKKESREQVLYHNTELLLKNYRQIVYQLKNQSVEIALSLEVPLHDIDALLSRIDAEIGMGNKRLETRLETQKRFRFLLSRTNEALTMLRQTPGGERLYKVVEITYIKPRPDAKTAAKIAEILNITTRQYYRLRQQAIAALSVNLWGAPSMEMEMMLDLMGIYGL